MRRTRRPAITLIECLAVLVVVALIAIYALRPRLTPNRVCSKRLVCASNLKGIGTSCKIYANDNNGAWPTPAFDQTAIGGIDYTVRVGGGQGSVRSPNRKQPSTAGSDDARQLSTTRAFWMLVRSGDIVERQFICPQSKMKESLEIEIDANYDFANGENISYGLQVPFGPPGTRQTDQLGKRVVLIADRGPYLDATVRTPPSQMRASKTISNWYGGDSNALVQWKPFNSPNHQGEGQNAYFGDGHVEFVRLPTVGVDNDNIYTIATNTGQPTDYTHGESPWLRSAPPRSLPDCSPANPSTDSVIFP